MKCQTCGDDNPEQAQFCAGCGAKLDEASSSDATSNPRPFPASLLIAIRKVILVKAIRVLGSGSLTGLGVAPAYYLLPKMAYGLLVLPAFIGIIVASVFRVRKRVLVTVGYLTLLSVASWDLGTGGFNLTHEQRNLSAYSFLSVGLVWGLVWSTPFALWAWLKDTK